MTLILPFIHPNKDNYLLDQVNCLEKTWTIVAEGKRSYFSNYYLILQKCFELYHSSNMKDGFLHYCRNTEDVMNLLGFKVHYFPIDKDIHETIRQQIDLQRPVLVCGNLKALYYSHHYKVSDWMHLFLIKGYNAQTEVYYIMDSAQKKNEGYKYDEFVITADMIESLATSSLNTYAVNCFLSIESLPVEPLESELLITCIQEILKAPTYNEILAMEQFQEINSGSSTKHIGPKLLGMIKSKDVLYTELVLQFRRFFGNTPLTDQIEEAAEQLIKEWRAVITDYLKSRTVGNGSFDVQANSRTAIQLEHSLRSCLEDGLDVLHPLRETQQKELTEMSWTAENNEAGIIKLDEERVKFCFQTDHEYDYSNSPKYIYPLKPNHKFIYNVQISVTQEPKVSAYQAGIVFRTKHGETYLWGLFNNEKVVLSKSIDPLFSYDINRKVVRLQVRLEDNGEYVFSVAEQDASLVEVYRTTMLAELSVIGVGFRNWYSVSSLQLDFKSHIECSE
ncbi:hypothetical protein [Paenibacillus tepidiphilus]|uniref:hypothetical protein n=1 Tax=Paenibacillus tepidiphilus TaxID=2608683 RepID=UPI0012390CD9|nr:hypothetical protein [Paenibacillus tepidiphilus]